MGDDLHDGGPARKGWGERARQFLFDQRIPPRQSARDCPLVFVSLDM